MSPFVKACVTVVRELYGLFVEDGRYTLAILVWVALLGLAAHVLPGASHWGAPCLFLGLALLLVLTVWSSGRAAARARRTPPPPCPPNV